MAQPTKTPVTTTDPTVIQEIWRSAVLVWRLMLDGRVSFLPKLILPIILFYILSPLDVIPDVLVGLGQLDDIALIFLGIKLFIHLCPPDIVAEHRRSLTGGNVATSSRPDYVDGTYRVVDEEK